MSNLLEAVFSKERMTRCAQTVLLYLIGQKLAKKPLPTIEELQNKRFFIGTDPYRIMGELLQAGYLTGSSNNYDVDFADLKPLVKPLITNGDASKTASNKPPSILELINMFRSRHWNKRGCNAHKDSKDMVVMRGINRSLGWERLPLLFEEFFRDEKNNTNKHQSFGILDFKKWLEKKGTLQTKFSAKSKG